MIDYITAVVSLCVHSAALVLCVCNFQIIVLLSLSQSGFSKVVARFT